MRPSRSELLACLLLMLLIGGAYFPALGYGFLNLDDNIFVPGNPIVREGLGAQCIERAFTSYHEANWIPLTWISHALDVTLFGLKASGHHATNLLLHALNACLVFLVLRRLTGAAHYGKCLLVAALFALHPAHVESVAWISERKGLLSTTFWWLTIGAYAGYAHRPSARRMIGVAALMALGLLAKATLVTLPLILLLLDYWPLRRLAPETQPETQPETDSETGGSTTADSAAGLGKLLIEKLPLVLLSVASVVITFFAQSAGGAVKTLESVPLAERTSNALLSYLRYLELAIWPSGLSPFHGRLSPEALQLVGPVGLSIVLLGLSSLIAYKARRSQPWLMVGWFWYLIALIPMIGFVTLGMHSIAERYTYVPYVGLWVALTWAAGRLWVPRQAGSTWPPAIVSLVAVLACFVLTRSQLQYWKHDSALWQRTLAVTSDNAFAHTEMANVLMEQNQLDEALAHAQRAVAIDPDYANAHHNMGSILGRKGQIPAAVAAFERALQVDPDFAPSQILLAVLYHDFGRFHESVELFEKSVSAVPANINYPGASERYGHALEHQLVLRQVSFEQGVEDLRRALELVPHWKDTALYLAWILATHPETSGELGAEALELALRGARDSQTPSRRELDVLAAAHAAAGKFPRAIKLAQRASAAAEPGERVHAQWRESIYKSKRPLRQEPRHEE